MILVATPDTAFGELLRFSLGSSGRHEVHLSSSCSEAIDQASRIPFAMAIIDCSLEECRIDELVNRLQKNQPSLSLVLIPPENDPGHPSLSGLHPAAYLNRPVYLPTMLKMVDQLLSREEKARESAPPPDAGKLDVPVWLQDPAAASQKLSGMLPSYTANAAFVCRSDSILASAGVLPPEDVQEITALVGRYWNSGEKGDLARFIHPGSAAGESLVYVTALDDGLALGMVFNNITPLTRSRQETVRLARSLRSLLTPDEIARRAARREEASHKPATAALVNKMPAGQTETPDAAFKARGSPSQGPEAAPFVTDEPVSTGPQNTPQPVAGINPAPMETVFIQTPPDLDVLVQPPPATSQRAVASSILAEVLPPLEPSEQQAEASADVLPKKIRLQDGTFEEPSSIPYTCLLLPRSPEQTLTGDLAEGLQKWLPEMCLAFGWRSCRVVINEQYLQLTIEVAPMVTPGSLLRVLRELTTQQIFARFPDLARQNPSEDFWAPGHLIVSGMQSPTGRMVREFIEKTRRRQHPYP